VVILANVLGIRLRRLRDGEAGAALGAARLGRLAATGESVEAVCRRAEAVEEIAPDAGVAAAYAEQYALYRAAYRVPQAG
jgi:xylulokinase